MQRLKIKGNLIRIRLLLHCSIRMMQGSDVSRSSHTVQDSHTCLMAAENVLLLWQLNQAKDWCRPEFRGVMWSWGDFNACYHASPSSPGKRFGECCSTQSQLARPVQPLSPGRVASCSCPLTHPSVTTGPQPGWRLAVILYICPAMNIVNILIVLGKVSSMQLILDPPVFPNVFPTLGLSLLHAWSFPFLFITF